MGNRFRTRIFRFFLMSLQLIFKFADGSFAGEEIPKRNGIGTSYREDDQMWQYHTATREGGGAREALDFSLKDRHIWLDRRHHPTSSSSSSSSHFVDPSSSRIFFHIEDLINGTKLPLYFPIQTRSPKILSKKLADTIPFASSQLPYLLRFFSFSRSSPQARAMEQTLKHCEIPSTEEETKFCATSLESMIDNTRRAILGQLDGSDRFLLKVLSTTCFHTNLTGAGAGLQNYTIMEDPEEILTSSKKKMKKMGCHPMPYPYKVFYCHGSKGDNKVFRLLLEGENGNVIRAFGICHMDTSQWEDDHVAFRVLGGQPGKDPVCHVFPPDNLVWIASLPTTTSTPTSPSTSVN